MKKISFSLSMFLLAATVAFLFIACQKEQTAATAEEETAASENNNIVGVNGGAIPGLITTSSAAALRSAYLKQAGKGESEYVQFEIKDLLAYLKAMKGKYGSDEVYVNFGVYDAKTVPNGNKSYIGRKTVFFSVNNKKKSGGNIVVNDDDDPNEPKELNHGTIFP